MGHSERVTVAGLVLLGAGAAYAAVRALGFEDSVGLVLAMAVGVLMFWPCAYVVEWLKSRRERRFAKRSPHEKPKSPEREA